MSELEKQFELIKQWNDNRGLSEVKGIEQFNKYRAQFHRPLIIQSFCNECGGTGRWKDDEFDNEINCPKCNKPKTPNQ